MKSKMKKLLSMIMALSLVLGMLPIMTAMAASDPYHRLVDAPTHNDYTRFFGEQVTHTEFAGAVWTDKSVFKDTDAVQDALGNSISMNNEEENFLIALSAAAANKSIVGYSSIPTDTMMVLDLSGSMSADDFRSMVTATNDAIRKLQGLNRNNRVGVVLYAGTASGDGYGLNTSTTLLLPLGRYKGVNVSNNETFIQYNAGSFFSSSSISVLNNVTTETGGDVANTSRNTAGATYIQAGLWVAWNQFKTADTVIGSGVQKGTQRMPVMVLMSDGAPSAATLSYDNPGTSHMGTGNASNCTWADVFATQLTAAYIKKEMEKHYGRSGLFYSLGLGVGNNDYALSVLNSPVYNNSPTVGTGINARQDTLYGYWNTYLAASDDANVLFEDYDDSRTSNDLYVTRDAEILGKDYVDHYYGASNSTDLINAFGRLVNQIIVQSKYYPTLVESGDHNLDGYVTIRDQLGDYMQVKDIHGLLAQDTLYAGYAVAKAIAQGTYGDLSSGNLNNLTSEGQEILRAVRRRLNCTEEQAEYVVEQALRNGQLSYTSDTEYSNYIGWFGDADGNYVGYWDGTDTAAVPAGATFRNRSYGYLGTVGTEAGFDLTDMLYISVQVHEEIATRHQTVIWKIPAALIPMTTYSITFEGNSLEEGAYTNLQMTIAEKSPIRLLFEVGLREDIDRYNITEKIANNYGYKNADGTYTFYTNSWDLNATDREHDPTWFDLQPSKENERYYHIADDAIYLKNGNSYVLATAKPAPTDGNIYYRAVSEFRHTPAANDGNAAEINYVYEEISPDNLDETDTMYKGTDNVWYIRKGTPILNVDLARVAKGNNVTGTLLSSFYPEVVLPTATDPVTHMAGTLGNNGKMTLTPVTGIKLTKVLTAAVPDAANDDFVLQVQLSAPTGATLADSYPLTYRNADGSYTETTVDVSDTGLAEVTIAADTAAYITDLPAGTTYTVSEAAHSIYRPVSITGATGVVVQHQLGVVDVVNEPKPPVQDGNLYISKTVEHPFIDAPTALANKTFQVTVELDAVPDGESFNSSIGALTVDDGRLTFPIKAGQTVAIYGIDEDTPFTVSETDLPAGFTLVTPQADRTGTIVGLQNSYVALTNRYVPAAVSPVTLTHEGTKELLGREWLDSDRFTFLLQDIENDTWTTISAKTVAKNDVVSGKASFSFTDALQAQVYDAVGSYSYHIIEQAGQAGGMTYDAVNRRFDVVVTDNDADGKLEISNVIAYAPTAVTTPTAGNANYHLTTAFTNRYAAVNGDEVAVHITKTVDDRPGVGKTPEGFVFELYATGATTPIATTTTDANGLASFDLTFNAAQAGETLYYTVKEYLGGTTVNGMQYTSKTYDLVVKLVDDNAGKVNATINLVDAPVANPTNQIDLTFQNVYAPTPATVDLTAQKVLSGRKLGAGEFTFQLKDTGSNVLQEKKNDANGTITFDPFTLDTVGTTRYTISEVITNTHGVTGDTTVYDVIVTVTDKGDGTLQAAVATENNGSPASAVFRNTYRSASNEVVISGTKGLTGRKLGAGEFTFQLKDANGQVLQEKTNDANGSFAFDALTYTQDDIYHAANHYGTTATVTYQVVEKQTVVAGVTNDTAVYDVTVTLTDNLDGTITAAYTVKKNGADASLVFSNTYRSASNGVVITGTKGLTGRKLGAGEFTFQLKDAGNNVLQEKQNDANGSFAFDALTYTQDDIYHAANHYGTTAVYYYTVSEKLTTVAGVTNDTTVYDITVTLTDNLDGTITAAYTVKKNGAPAVVQFINRYASASNEVVIRGTKALTGRKLEDNTFRFDLLDSEGRVVDYAYADANGNFVFDALTYTQDDIYHAANNYSDTLVLTYKVRENTDGIPGYYTCDPTVFDVIVTVKEQGNGTIAATYVTKKAGVDAFIDFTNEYHSASDAVRLSGTKVLTGRKLKAGEFTFQLKDASGQVLQEKTNDANGTFAFDALTYTQDDIYNAANHYGTTATVTYQVVEKQTVVAGVTNDTAVYDVTVTLTDNLDGTITASAAIKKAGNAATILFENRYASVSNEVKITAHKTLVGRDLKAGEFTFQLKDANGHVLQEKTNDANGNIVFDALTYTQDDIYHAANNHGTTATVTYQVQEVKGQAGGVSYATAVYDVTVTLTDNGDGTVTATEAITLNGLAAEPVFENGYASGDVQVTIRGHKTLNGRQLQDGEFAFLLTDEKGNAVETVKNNADGLFVFAPLTFDKAGTFTYTVSEVKGNAEGVTYDDRVYTVTVEVTDNGDGTKSATVTSLLENETADISFTNIYKPAPPVQPESPQTGYAGQLAAWAAVLFVSGTGLLGTTLLGRKRREENK
ncbi:MAG: VWA domain-containing protein [Ruminococcaceae bacterium]|nr:VWA domain-containing protein [Oscillospiraceae bacterium]